MLRNKGKNLNIPHLVRALYLTFILFRQRKLKEAREVAEAEVAKYRREK